MALLTVTDSAAGIRLARAAGPQEGYVQLGIFQAGEALAAGDAVYIDANTKIWKADASADDAAAKAYGIILEAVAVGDWRTVYKSGPFAGYSKAANGLIYLSDTPGRLGDAAGTVSIVVGFAYTRPEGKICFLDFPIR